MSQIHNKINSKQGRSPVHLITDYRLLITALALALTGCMGVYEGGFECPPGTGVGCKSISEVNSMVDQGDLPERSLADLPERSLPDLPQIHCEHCRSNQDQQMTPEHPSIPEIWYFPSFTIDREETIKTKALDDAISI